MRKLRKKTAALLKDRKGNMMPLVVAVTICMLIIILGVAEYMRLVITAAGIKDAMESAVISTVNDNYNEVYHSVREGYAAGYEPDGESFSPSVDYGYIYSRMCFLLGLEEDGAGYVRINNGGEMEYCLSNLCVYIHKDCSRCRRRPLLCRCLHQTGGAGKICRKDHHQYVNKSKGSGSLYREILVRCYRYRATYYILIDFCKVVW